MSLLLALTSVGGNGATAELLFTESDDVVAIGAAVSAPVTGAFAVSESDDVVSIIAASESVTPTIAGRDDTPRRAKRYLVQDGETLRVFGSKAAAVRALDAMTVTVADDNEAPQVAEITADEPIAALPDQYQINLPHVRHYAQITGVIEHYNEAYNSRHYAALIAMFEQMQDEDDVEMLLLTI